MGLLMFRVMLGTVMFVHGAQKVLGWWGGKGLEATVVGMSERMGIPIVLPYAAAFSEFLGGILIAIGLYMRPSAAFVGITMLVASSQHLDGGFLSSNKGFEYPLTLAIMAIGLMFTGPGKYSLDALISSRDATEPDNKQFDPAVEKFRGSSDRAGKVARI